ncbi:MAG: peptidase U32 family protein, partial [Alkalispirochaeta sp.]
MELLSPAGNLEKLATAFRYGADAAYIGVAGFSLRAHADTLGGDPKQMAARIREIKPPGRRLYAALNLFAHQQDLDRLPEALEVLHELPIDAVILADIGLIDPVTTALPEVELHLSTQANCTNAAAAKLYHRLGFSRIVPARELSLDEVKAIKDAVPGLELEVFVHGAMCMAYSGRCVMSDVMAGRSANRGDCAQSCRWKYSVEHYRLEEEQRPGEYIPVETDGRFTTILSSRDLMLFDHVAELMSAGVDAAKIEGRMKSSLYTAAVTRSYRAAID